MQDLVSIKGDFRIVSIRDLLMQTVSASVILTIGMMLEGFNHLNIAPKLPIPEAPRGQIKGLLKGLRVQFEILDLAQSLKFTDTTLRALDGMHDYDMIKSRLNALYEIAQGELDDHLFLQLNEKQAEIMTMEKPFGERVNNVFPESAHDVSECYVTFALERYTASVFHAMRVMEVTLKRFSRLVGAPDPTKDADRNWGAMLRKIKDRFDDLNRAKATNWLAQKDACDRVYSHLDAVRIAWRNPVMHVEATYQPDRAEKIVNAVKTFASELAEDIETGVIAQL